MDTQYSMGVLAAGLTGQTKHIVRGKEGCVCIASVGAACLYGLTDWQLAWLALLFHLSSSDIHNRKSGQQPFSRTARGRLGRTDVRPASSKQVPCVCVQASKQAVCLLEKKGDTLLLNDLDPL